MATFVSGAVGSRHARSAFFIGMLVAVARTPAGAESLRIDLGMNTGRNDTAAPGWIEWQVADGPAPSRSFGAVTVTLKADEGDVKGAWYKTGLATGAPMATDGVTTRGPLTVTITGLPPGVHTVATYHNWLQPSGGGKLAVSLIQARETLHPAVPPSRRAADDWDAVTTYHRFEVASGDAVKFRILPDENDPQAILNGLEVDGPDPAAKAVRPTPAHDDEHVDAESGRVRLAWQAAPSAVKHHVYYAADADRHAALAEASSADHESTAYLGETEKAAFEVAVPAHDSLLHHAWRVDSVDAAGVVTRGEVWRFRVRHLAFPGAEGYGRFAVGGRGGKVIHVTTLADGGPGSLRAALETNEPRTIVFDVSGRIDLKSRTGIRNPYLTIAGQTAPGKGICISNYNLGMLGTHDVIVRHLRVRPGDTAGETLDGMGMASSDHAIIDHCSVSWTQDESVSSRGAKNVTLQRTLISEALNVAGHKKYEKGKQHGYAASISGDIGSFHHNLLAHCAGRNWSLAGGLDKATRHAGRLDIRNNVVYNWSHRTTDGGAKQVNFINNYYKPGPASQVFHILMSEREAVPAFGPQDYHVAGNVMEGKVAADVPHGGVISKPSEPLENFLHDEPFFPSFVQTQSAEEALENVLADVGCTRPQLDEHDRRVIEETRAGTTTYRGSVSGLPGLPDSQRDVGGWEDYPEIHRPADFDADGDGMPGGWERARGLDPNSQPGDFTEAHADPDGDGYTNLEDYLNELAK